MADAPTTGDLFKAKAVTEDELTIAADAYLATPDIGPFPIAKGFRIDVAAAVEASTFAKGMVARADVAEGSKRSAVKSAILLARPVKG